MAHTILVGSRGQFTMQVDEIDYDFLIRWPWTFARSHPGSARELVYARRTVRVAGDPVWTSEGVVEGGKKKFDLFVHHVILARMGFPGPPEEGWTGDHRNTDTLDNCRDNLQWASPTFQGKNRRDRRHEAHVREALAAMAPTHTLPAW